MYDKFIKFYNNYFKNLFLKIKSHINKNSDWLTV